MAHMSELLAASELYKELSKRTLGLLAEITEESAFDLFVLV